MAFSTKRIYYVGDALDVLPTSHGQQTAAASIGTIDIQKQVITFNIACDSVANATKATAAAALTTALTTACDAQIGTTMAVDTTGSTVSYNCKVTSITRGLAVSDIFYDEASDVYVVKTEITVANS